MRFQSHWVLPLLAASLASPQPGFAEPVREPAFELAGVAKGDGDESFAVLKEPELTKGASVVVRRGQVIGDYQLVAVEDDRVVLQSEHRVITVHLGGAKSSPGTETPSAPAKPAPDASSVQGPAAPTSVPPALRNALNPNSTTTAEESVEAALKRAEGEKALNMLKNAFGSGTAKP